MGAGQFPCCSGDRSKRPSQQKAVVDGNVKPERKHSARISVAANNAYADRRGVSIGYHSVGDDARKFDEAFDNNNLAGFVALLSSTQPIDSFEDRLHPWAEDPKTIGSLACTQLAILASVAEKEQGEGQGIKNEIREAGAIPHLAEFLKSKQTDRVQAAMVTFSFLTTECPPNVVAAYEAGSMPLIVEHLDSPIVGMRAASATVLRDMFTERREYLDKFRELGGITRLVAQLSKPVDPSMSQADVQLEAVLNIQDLIENPNAMVPQVDEDIAREVIRAGAEEPLRRLKQTGDQDLQASADELLEMLTGVPQR